MSQIRREKKRRWFQVSLRRARNLEKLYNIDTRVTAAGVLQLREAFPNAKVYDRIWRTSAEEYQ